MEKHIKLEYIQSDVNYNLYNPINETVIDAIPCNKTLDFGKDTITESFFDFFNGSDYQMYCPNRSQEALVTSGVKEALKLKQFEFRVTRCVNKTGTLPICASP